MVVGEDEGEHGCCCDRRRMGDAQVAIGCLGGRDGGVVADVETSEVGL